MPGNFDLRKPRGIIGTAVAAAAMVVLTASQAPGVQARPAKSTGPSETPISGAGPYYTELPPLTAPDKPPPSADKPESGSAGTGGAAVPATIFDAYGRAEAAVARSNQGCNLPWQILAAIGQVESGQAWGGRVTADGTTRSPILGPRLNGNGFANISDTDDGAYDGDAQYDRAVGPMQFIPSTWATWGADGNSDGKKNPSNIYDASLAAGHYLCADGRDLSSANDLNRAILGYNHSSEYLRTVTSWFEYFKRGHHEVPDSTETAPYPSPDSASGRSASRTAADQKPERAKRSDSKPKRKPEAPEPDLSPSPGRSGSDGGPDEPPPVIPGIKPESPGNDKDRRPRSGLKGTVDSVTGPVADGVKDTLDAVTGLTPPD